MKTNKYKLALEKAENILHCSDETRGCLELIFSELKEIIDYDYAVLCYLNADRLNIKSVKNYTKIDIFPANTTYLQISAKTKALLLDSDILNFDNNSDTAKDLKLFTQKSNFLLAGLAIRKTVFGFIILAKNDASFEKEDEAVLKAFGSFCSYSIKDSELSEVFKLQFKTLQDDINEKAKAYKIIEEQNKKILEADVAKNEFIANISHELRTPLNAVIGFTEALKAELFGPLNKKQTEYMNDIHISGIHLLGMINEILDISKIESNAMSINLSEFDIQAAIKEVVNIIKPLADKKQIQIDEKTVSKNISADYQKIQQILYNLLSNAIKFTPNKGKIEIGAGVEGRKISIWVKDNGIGIDKKYQGKIFAKFVQLENIYTKKASSTGLGLTITKELVNMHKGKIYVESKLNEGTKFTVELPLGQK